MWFDDKGLLHFYGFIAGYMLENVVFISKKFQCGETGSLALLQKVEWISQEALDTYLQGVRSNVEAI